MNSVLKIVLRKDDSLNMFNHDTTLKNSPESSKLARLILWRLYKWIKQSLEEKLRSEKLTKLQEMEWMDVFETRKTEAQTLKAEIKKRRMRPLMRWFMNCMDWLRRRLGLWRGVDKYIA